MQESQEEQGITLGTKQPVPDHPLNLAPTSAPPEHRIHNHLTELRPDTAPTAVETEEAQGSSAERGQYTEHWDTGFAQDGDPYGISREYTSQSANEVDRRDASEPAAA